MRIGIDLGGTKIEAVVMDEHSKLIATRRTATPGNDYDAIIRSLADLVAQVEQDVDDSGLNVGMCTPGSLSPTTGLIRNSNTVVMNGRAFKSDVEHALQRDIRTANDADCLALSEAHDGAARGAQSVFGVILGTGCGGGVVIGGALQTGVNAIGGEWGHNPLPWPNADDSYEWPYPECWCGSRGCNELFLSGTGLQKDYQHHTGTALSGQDIAAKAQQGNTDALACIRRYHARLARGLASVINLLDPAVIVLGGGASNMQTIYSDVPALMEPYVFSDDVNTKLVQAQFGDSSGVRGAAWLWPE